MSISPQSPSFNSSIASSLHENYDDPEATRVKNYIKDALKARIFLGRYVERRLVDKNVGYRDVVVISPAEVDLKRDLIDAQHKLRVVCPKTPWIGITEGEGFGLQSAGIALWTEIDNQPFGPFWFQIKSLRFRESEIMITLKCLRHISDAFLEVEPILTGVAVRKTKDKTDKKLESSVASLNETCADIADTFKGFLSISNVREFVTFLFAFVIAIFTGSTAFVNFLGNFILALIREMSILLKNSTPMFLGLLDFFSKIVGGFYILLAMMFKQSAPVPTNKRTLTYYDRANRNAGRYDDSQFD